MAGRGAGSAHQNRYQPETKKAFQAAGCRGIIPLPGCFYRGSVPRCFDFRKKASASLPLIARKF
jgi:hypothetical protein